MVPARIAARVALSGGLALALALPGLAGARSPHDQILDELATLNAKIDALQAAVADVADVRGLALVVQCDEVPTHDTAYTPFGTVMSSE